MKPYTRQTATVTLDRLLWKKRVTESTLNLLLNWPDSICNVLQMCHLCVILLIFLVELPFSFVPCWDTKMGQKINDKMQSYYGFDLIANMLGNDGIVIWPMTMLQHSKVLLNIIFNFPHFIAASSRFRLIKSVSILYSAGDESVKTSITTRQRISP